jgi:hypothetical protein
MHFQNVSLLNAFYESNGKIGVTMKISAQCGLYYKYIMIVIDERK